MSETKRIIICNHNLLPTLSVMSGFRELSKTLIQERKDIESLFTFPLWRIEYILDSLESERLVQKSRKYIF